MDASTVYVIAVSLLGAATSARVKHEGMIPPLQLIDPRLFNLMTTFASIAGLGMLIWGFVAFGWQLALIAFAGSIILGTIAVVLAGHMFILFAFIWAVIGTGLSAYVVLTVGT